MDFPIVRVIRPRDLSVQMNGRLDTSLLREVGPRRDWKMHHLAARCWEAMRAAAASEGILLSYSGNPYRDYDGQVSLFRSRYTSAGPTSLDRKGRLWGGQRWYRYRGAPAAVPGTSNHGWGLAVDVALDLDGDGEFEWPPKNLDRRALDWLRANAGRFGFSWELQNEPWHLRMVTGDALPQAVLDFENGVVSTDNPLAAVAAAIDAARAQTLRRGSKGDAVRWLQHFLTAAGFKTSVDGDFGPKTETQVRAFQSARGLTSDGVVGGQTWKALVG